MYTTSYKNIHENLYKNSQPQIFPHTEILVRNSHFEKEFWENWLLEEIEKLLVSWKSTSFDIISQAYAWFQFGNFAILWDGRAHLLGEHEYVWVTHDIQLKGSWLSPFSRGGDGKATVKAMLREFLISEAMHALRIPTSRSLTVFQTHEEVHRTHTEPGAVLVRIAKSHIRVGTFSYARAYEDTSMLTNLFEYTLQRHYPHLVDNKNSIIEFIREVWDRQIALIIDWLRVGFIHGVMNTDNTFISWETLDYGPCAFMNGYKPHTVFSSIDKNGRYSYINQMPIIIWNLTRLIEALLPLMSPSEEESLEHAKRMILEFQEKLSFEYSRMMHQKIGISTENRETAELIQELLSLMERGNLDFTNTFLSLEKYLISPNYHDATVEVLALWIAKWIPHTNPLSLQIMQEVNPSYIPRNHLVEKALTQAEWGDMTYFHQFLKILESPYSRTEILEFQESDPNDSLHKTFCGT